MNLIWLQAAGCGGLDHLRGQETAGRVTGDDHPSEATLVDQLRVGVDRVHDGRPDTGLRQLPVLECEHRHLARPRHPRGDRSVGAEPADHEGAAV